ncbi:hypothetical protein ACFVWX_10335 [Streptomyces sp. NPDC058220]|uniref:hypothetical protein n=1 Tax=unclassified Streptomyces TaxID=2593676 RepID=UPI003666238D
MNRVRNRCTRSMAAAGLAVVMLLGARMTLGPDVSEPAGHSTRAGGDDFTWPAPPKPVEPGSTGA